MFSKGIDASLWDGGKDHHQPLNWAAYDWDFAFIKVSEGLVRDPLFAIQWAAARGHVVRSGYHFFRPAQDPKASALKTIEILDGDLGELPVAFDLEVTDGMSAAPIMERAKTWLAWYEQETGIRPIIYSSLYFLRDIVKASNHSWLANYKLWLAQYPYDELEPAAVRDLRIADILAGYKILVFPPPPAPFKRVSFWQWTALGKPDQVPGYHMGPGYKKEVDFNFYNGSRELMAAEFKLGGLPDPEPPSTGDPMPEYTYSITPVFSDGYAVRPEPDTGNTKLSPGLPFGKYAYGNRRITIAEDKYELIGGRNTQVNKADDVWLEVLEVNGTVLAQPAYIAEIHLGKRFATIQQIGTPAPDPEPPAGEDKLEIFVNGQKTFEIVGKITTG